MKIAKTVRSRSSRHEERGAILMVVLIVMIALLGLGMTGLFLTSGSIQMNSNINLRNQALVVAEAGIEHARAILNNKSVAPNMPALLGQPASPHPADEIPTSIGQCESGDAFQRGAILRDGTTPLADREYPQSVTRSDFPGAGGAPSIPATMGRYTVYIRQDLRDCRMGNLVCDYAPVSSVSNGGAGGAGGGGGAGGAGGAGVVGTCAAEPALEPNRVVIVRSEGVAVDGRTRVVLEVTMSPGHGASSAGGGVPLSALCASGANGCDDNSNVQTGIVVNNPTPGAGGAAGSGAGGAAGGAGGGTGAGGATGAGGITGLPPGAGGASAGGAGGLPGAGGTGGGSGGSTGCKSTKCVRIATLGVWGLWNRYVSKSSNDSGSAMFREFLGQANDECQMVGSITDFGGGRLLADDPDPLKNYNVLILLDMYHTNADRWGCANHWEVKDSSGNVQFGCSWPVLNCYPNGNGVYKRCPLVGQHDCGWTCPFNRYCDDSTNACEKPNFDCSVCGTSYAPQTTSYSIGHRPPLSTAEVDYLVEWVKRGNGIVTTAGYYYDAPHVQSVNAILRRVGLKYDTVGGSDTGKVIKSLEAADGNDLCATAPTGSPYCPGGTLGDANGDFLRTDGTTPGHYPFDFLYQKTGDASKWVKRLQVRGAIPLVPVTPVETVTRERSVRVQCPRPIQDTYYGNNTHGDPDQRCNTGAPAACGSNESDSTYWRDIGYTVKDIGGTSGGRVVAWGDEWLTYNTLWSAWNQNVYDPNEYPCQNPSSVVYQAAAFWGNIIGWLTEKQTCN